MKRSTDRILTTHVGRLQRPDQLTEILVKQQAGGNVDEQALAHRLKAAIADVVEQQAEAGVTVVNDGEFGKISWLLNVIWTKPLPRARETDFETIFSSLSFGFPASNLTDVIRTPLTDHSAATARARDP